MPALRMSRREILLLAAAAAAGCARPPAGAQDLPGPPERPLAVAVARDASPEFRAVADALAEAMRAARIPGAALGVLAGGREEHAVLGLSSLSSLRPVTPETLFQIGSLTKIYTATAIWCLVDNGQLQPDALVRRYLRGLRLSDEQVAATVTIDNLLHHTAGWYGDETVDTGDDSDALGRYIDTRLPELPQLFGCGEFFSYNNSAFQLLGRLVEVAAGTDYNDALQRLMLGPLGLGSTVLDRAAVLKRAYADGHAAMTINGREAVVLQTPLWIPRCADPAGGIWSTTRDVLRFARMHLGIEEKGSRRPPLLKPATLRAMREPTVPVPGLELSMGRSWFVQEADGVRVISHDGDTLGQHTVFVAVPERRFAFVLMLNGQPGAVTGLAALDEALARFPGLAPLSGRVGLVRALQAPDGAATADLSRSQLNRYAGDYADPGATDTFRVAGDGLERRSRLTPRPGSWQPDIPPPPPPETEPVRFLAEDSAVSGGRRLPFVRDADGAVGWVSDGLRLRPRS